jgi:short-subunit dehydrogenase
MHTFINNHFAKRYGPCALVTGASEGIGASFAEELARRGLHVVLVARREDRLNELATRLEANYGVLCPVICADLSSSEDVEAMFKITDHIDIGLVVCNAGYGTAGNFLDSDLDNELDMLSVNCKTVTQMVHHLGLKLKAKGRGGVILLSSIVATQGVARLANYAATKAYIQTLGEGLQQEWRRLGIDLLIVSPGPVATGFALRSKMKLGKASTPEVVAKQSLKALGRQKMIHPGWLAKVMSFALSTAPRKVKILIMGAIMGSMTKQLPK